MPMFRRSPKSRPRKSRAPPVHASVDNHANWRTEEVEENPNAFYRGGPFSGGGDDAERLRAFQKSISHLDLNLQQFANAIRRLGSSVGLLGATAQIQRCLPRILHLFQVNASKLFDTGVAAYTPDFGVGPPKRNRRSSVLGVPVIKAPSVLEPQMPRINELPGELNKLAEALRTLVKRLYDVPEFVDETVHTTHWPVNKAFRGFADDLSYRADCLGDSEFKNQLGNIAFARHINELTDDLSSQADHMSDALKGFIDAGIPAIRYFQERTADRLQNLSTTATFFSAVSATTIQFSYSSRGVLQDLLNVLWISSLVFSIASAINSQLAYHWREVTYRSPGCYVPWWIYIWITYTPLLFLVVSVFAFLFGLCVFTYSTGQPSVVTVGVTAFTILTSSTLLCVGIWFLSERWTYLRTQGSHWLVDVLDEHVENTHKFGSSLVAGASSFTTRGLNRLRHVGSRVIVGLSYTVRRGNTLARNNHGEAGIEMDEEAQNGEARKETDHTDLPMTRSQEDLKGGAYRRSCISSGGESSCCKEIEHAAKIPGHESMIPHIQTSPIVTEPLSDSRVLDAIGTKKYSKQVGI
ncbi:hypothetical protein RSOLAG22IIIB_11114 [Rhizoctonia solani]|uniref:Uncharacterized protein n=1 Tax=Rhizoctonia solani TaxID=456999 RepID=A0A0K6G745_9AGAM|nr:hypothetical protein RSOLAG22IIIB_11114 [Rhizoctonia solani]